MRSFNDMELPRTMTGRWMFITAVLAVSLGLGRILHDLRSKEIPRPVVIGLVCLLASAPILVPLIEFVRTFRSPD
jgi:hypothetical protein